MQRCRPERRLNAVHAVDPVSVPNMCSVCNVAD